MPYSGHLNKRIRIRNFYFGMKISEPCCAELEDLRKIFSVVSPLIKWMDFRSLKQIHFVQSTRVKQTDSIFWPLKLHEDKLCGPFLSFLRLQNREVPNGYKIFKKEIN